MYNFQGHREGGGRRGRLPQAPNLRGAPNAMKLFCNNVLNILNLILLNIPLDKKQIFRTN